MGTEKVRSNTKSSGDNIEKCLEASIAPSVIFERNDGGVTEILRFGVVDILQPWNKKKMAEKAFKRLKGQKDCSSQPPLRYAERFCAYLAFVFQDSRCIHEFKG